MPRNALTVAAWFADKMASKKRNVGSEDRRHEVEYFIGHQPFEQFGMLKVRDIHRLRANIGLQVTQDFLEAVFESGKLFWGKNRLPEYVITLVVVLGDFARGQAMSRRASNRGGRHKWVIFKQTMVARF